MAKNHQSEPEPEPNLDEESETEEEESVGTDKESESSQEEGSEEEEEKGSEDEEEKGSEDEEEEPPQPKIIPVGSSNEKVHKTISSEDDEKKEVEVEEEEEEESYALVKKSDPGITSIADRDLSQPKKPKSKTEIAVPTSPAKPGVKRPAEKEAEVKETKKPKKNPDSTVEGENNSGVKGSSVISDDSKKLLFQRLWSEEDEIVILKGMLDYFAKKKADPVSDFGAFLEFIKKSLHVEVTKTQLQDKVRRLKRKFVNHASIKEKTGKERTFSKSHDQMAYDLSKKIWGKSSNGGISNEIVPETPNASVSVVKKSSNNVEVEDHMGVEVLKNGSFSSSLSYSSVAEWILNDGSKLMERKKREEMEEKWKKIQKQEVEVFLKRTEFICEQTKLVLEAMRKSEH